MSGPNRSSIRFEPVKSHTVYRTFRTEQRREFVRITDDVADAVREAGIAEGMVLVSAMHITAGVWINDDEPGIQADALEWLDKLAPPSWREPDGRGRAGAAARSRATTGTTAAGEDNGDAHLKNLLVHHQVIVPVTDGELDLGPVAADLLLRVRRPAAEAARDQGDGGVAVGDLAVFADGRRSTGSGVALVTGGGTNLGKAAAAELVRCGASVVIAGRREEVLEDAPHASSETGAPGWPGTSGTEKGQTRSCGAASIAMVGSTSCSTTPGGQYFAPAEGITAKGWRAVQRLNVDGTLAMCRGGI